MLALFIAPIVISYVPQFLPKKSYLDYAYVSVCREGVICRVTFWAQNKNGVLAKYVEMYQDGTRFTEYFRTYTFEEQKEIMNESFQVNPSFLNYKHH